MLGLGHLAGRSARRSCGQVATAIAAGYRLIDTAENYRNEEGVGEGIRASGVDRSVIFLTSKLNREWHSVDGVRQALRGQPRPARHGLPRPVPDPLAQPRPGPLRRRGPRARGAARGGPAAGHRRLELQAGAPAAGRRRDRHHPRRQPGPAQPVRHPARRARDRRQYGIATESWSPLGASSTALREDPRLTGIAERLDKTPTQVILRWHVQMGLVAIPKSTSPEHLAENIGVFDFELDRRGHGRHRRARRRATPTSPTRTRSATDPRVRPLTLRGPSTLSDVAPDAGDPTARRRRVRSGAADSEHRRRRAGPALVRARPQVAALESPPAGTAPSRRERGPAPRERSPGLGLVWRAGASALGGLAGLLEALDPSSMIPLELHRRARREQRPACARRR